MLNLDLEVTVELSDSITVTFVAGTSSLLYLRCLPPSHSITFCTKIPLKPMPYLYYINVIFNVYFVVFALGFALPKNKFMPKSHLRC